MNEICSFKELARAAQSAGAKIKLGRKFQSLSNHPARDSPSPWNARRSGEERFPNHSRTVIGADGAVSRVAKAAGMPKPSTAPLLQAIVDLPAGMAPDTVRVWFIPDDTPYFYWLIPHSPTQGVLGSHWRRRAFRNEAGSGTISGKAPTDAAGSYQGAQNSRSIPDGLRCAGRWTGGEVYLVGDAAGHVKVSTVGGIVTGFRGALGVVDAIMNGGSSRRLRALRRELDTHLLVRKLIHGFTQKHYSNLVDLLSARVRKDLEAHTRDEPGGIPLAPLRSPAALHSRWASGACSAVRDFPTKWWPIGVLIPVDGSASLSNFASLDLQLRFLHSGLHRGTVEAPTRKLLLA